MKYKPVYEHQDGRGVSEKYKIEADKRRRARALADKLLGKNYFTNAQAVILKAAMDLNKDECL
jgi:Zn-dependent metalloprotease